MRNFFRQLLDPFGSNALAKAFVAIFIIITAAVLTWKTILLIVYLGTHGQLHWVIEIIKAMKG